MNTKDPWLRYERWMFDTDLTYAGRRPNTLPVGLFRGAQTGPTLVVDDPKLKVVTKKGEVVLVYIHEDLVDMVHMPV